MKIFNIIPGFQLLSFSALAQYDSNPAPRADVEQLRSEAYKAAEVFLNPANSLEVRRTAMAKYSSVFDESQIAGFKKVLFNTQEATAIRAIALTKISHFVSENPDIWTNLLAWISNKATPKELRDASVNTLETLTFSLFGKEQEFKNVLRSLVTDPELRYRQFALSYLCAHGDSFAQETIISQLKNNKTDLLPTHEAINILALNAHGDYLPVVNEVFQTSQSAEVKLAAIRILGNYLPAKTKITSLIADKAQVKAVRHMALSAFIGAYPDEFPKHALTILQDRKETVDLKVKAIAYEKKVKKITGRKDIALEKAIEDLSRTSTTPELKLISRQYFDDETY